MSRQLFYSAAFLLAQLDPLHAELKFSQTTQAVTAKPEGEILKVRFPFKNEGSQVTVSRFDTGCGCLTGKLDGGKTSYRVGDEGVAILEIDTTNLHGIVEKSIDLWEAGKKDAPAVTLKVQVAVPDLIQIEPKTLRWAVGEANNSKTIKITMNAATPIRVIGVSGGEAKFDAKFATIEEGRVYEIKVTPSATDSPSVSSLRIETDCKIERLKSAVAFVAVSQAAAVRPPTEER